jgi:hypothetical protein
VRAYAANGRAGFVLGPAIGSVRLVPGGDAGDLALRVGRRLEAADEVAWVDAEAAGDLKQVVEVEVALAALDLAEEGPVDADLVGGGLLTEMEGLAAGAHALSECAGSGG